MKTTLKTKNNSNTFLSFLLFPKYSSNSLPLKSSIKLSCFELTNEFLKCLLFALNCCLTKNSTKKNSLKILKFEKLRNRYLVPHKKDLQYPKKFPHSK